MSKKIVAVIFGGFSPEYGVSLNSAYSVINAIDRSKYDVLTVGITNKGQWYRYTGSVEDLPSDKWHTDERFLNKAFISPERGGGIIEYDNGIPVSVPVDVIFPVLHGRYGEDGTIQGLCELAGIPVIGSGSAASALCMDKDRSHKLVSLAGITVPKSICLDSLPTPEELLKEIKDLELPLFVKPVKAGSSIGVSKHEDYTKIHEAVKEAFIYDDVVIIEENIDGKEVGCSVVGNHKLMTGRVNEIEVSEGFFSFEEKYTLKTSKIHTPARIDPKDEKRLQEVGKKVFQTLGCRGYARIDLFLKKDGEIVFSEANTIPGFTAQSQLPRMMKAAGIDYPELVDILIELALEAETGEWYGIAENKPKPDIYGRAWVEINMNALVHNIADIRRASPPTAEIMAVLKADAYGHGVERVARRLVREGIKAFAVATVAEGVKLRSIVPDGEILVLGSAHPNDIDCLLGYKLTQLIVDDFHAKMLNDAINKMSTDKNSETDKTTQKLNIHVAIDTGMHRLGIESDNFEEIEKIFNYKNLIVVGTATHLASPDSLKNDDIDFTKLQMDRFYSVVQKLKNKGYDAGKLHTQSSYGIYNYPELLCDYTRPGIMLFGVHSQDDETKCKSNLRPMLSLKADISQVRWIKAGESVSYSRLYTATKPIKIATIGIGYADGIPRQMTGKGGMAIVGGKKVPIIGRICMDMLILDVTEVDDVKAGDVAIFIGSEGDETIHCEEVAAAAGTITNDILCRLGNRLPRIYI